MIFKTSMSSYVLGNFVVLHNVLNKTTKTKTTIFLEPPQILSHIRINDDFAMIPAKHEPYHSSNGNAFSKLYCAK